MTDATLNNSLTATVSSGNSAVLRAAIDPGNPRQFGVIGVAPQAADLTVSVSAGGKVGSMPFTVTAPTVSAIELGTDSGEIDPPSWLL
jgi:hypothetical protein